MIKEKTICAQATAPGDAGIAIIRISGQDALKILKTVFRKKTDEFEPRHMYLATSSPRERPLTARWRSILPRRTPIPERTSVKYILMAARWPQGLQSTRF